MVHWLYLKQQYPLSWYTDFNWEKTPLVMVHWLQLKKQHSLSWYTDFNWEKTPLVMVHWLQLKEQHSLSHYTEFSWKKNTHCHGTSTLSEKTIPLVMVHWPCHGIFISAETTTLLVAIHRLNLKQYSDTYIADRAVVAVDVQHLQDHLHLLVTAMLDEAVLLVQLIWSSTRGRGLTTSILTHS